MRQGREKNNDDEESDNYNDSHEATSSGRGRGRHTSTSILDIKNKMKEAGENVKALRVRWLLLWQPFGKDNNNPVSR